MIKNLSFITDQPEDVINEMKLISESLKISDNISLKIVEYGNSKLIIQASQAETETGLYQSQKQIIQLIHDRFDNLFDGLKIIVHAIPFLQSPADIVNDKWLNKKMLLSGKSVKMISAETGLERFQITNLLSGKIQFSKTEKALFYYYFEYIELTKGK